MMRTTKSYSGFESWTHGIRGARRHWPAEVIELTQNVVIELKTGEGRLVRGLCFKARRLIRTLTGGLESNDIVEIVEDFYCKLKAVGGKEVT